MNHLTSNELVLIEKPTDEIAVVRLNKLNTLNQLDIDLITKLNDILFNLDLDPVVKVVIIAGHTEFFMSGVDLESLKNITTSDGLKFTYIEELQRILPKFRKPLLCAVNGQCLGIGFDIALAADITICNQTAEFGFTEVTLAVQPSGGGTQRLPRIVGKSLAMQMILTGETIRAETAKELRIVSKVVEGDALTETVEVARKIAEHSLPTLILAKNSVNTSFELGLNAGIRHEFFNFLTSLSLDDKNESIAAALEKRKPNISNK